MSLEKKSFEIPVIHDFRGIAALSVVLYHFVYTTTDYIQTEWVLDIFHFGRKGVQLFFIISGIVIPLSMIKASYQLPKIGKFLLRRFARIEPPFLVSLALGILFLFARNYFPSAVQVDLSPSLRDIFLHFGYLVPFVSDAKWVLPVYWTLSIEFQYYLFLAILFPLVMSKKPVLKWLFALIVIGIPLIFPVKVSFFPRWAPYFGLGIFYAMFLTKHFSLREFLAAGILSIVMCLTVSKIEWVDIGLATVAIAVIHFFPYLTTKGGRFFGKISYSLYLFHSLIGARFINFMSHRTTEAWEKFLVITVGVILATITAYIVWKLVERPSQLLSKKV
ncbi:acyltransferase [Pontibacter sp. G13]|uniref:acyltransferase family protein n=1 Tax=Pontibacter sp. G13 TaxID=3074898 RepID=UPI00288AC5CD|nr:acyltransferase [Pontibacter sp. G13]WNJ18802.1 acyltransferase [Pontibacter sp. G13]